jgi:ribosome biogenesis GTPase
MKRNSDLGFTEELGKEAELYQGLHLGRVTSQHKELYKVATETSEVTAEVSGKLRHEAAGTCGFPCVGDFVLVDREDGASGNAIIRKVLKRKSVFIRKAAGKAQEAQVVAANIDTVFICMSLNRDFNLRRVERYLSIAWDSGATPVIVLTKSDLCDDLPARLAEIYASAPGVDVVVTSSMQGNGCPALKKYIVSGKTAAFLGSSGVGKSTLINRLLGKDVISTREIGNEDKGRHTTTTRELFLIPSGGAVIDTPGMRELGLESANVSKAFADIEELSKMCRFRDCSHAEEPGCEVKRAIEKGIIDEERLESYTKLKKEAKYEGLTSRQIEKEKTSAMYADFGGAKNAREYVKSKRKNH